MKEHNHTFIDHTQQRMNKILDPQYPISRDDVVWMLGYITKKVADQDPAIRNLSQPQLLKIFHAYAEVTMALVVRHSSNDQEADRIREWLREASQDLRAN